MITPCHTLVPSLFPSFLIEKYDYEVLIKLLQDFYADKKRPWLASAME